MSPGRCYYLFRRFFRGGARAAYARSIIQPRLLKAAPIQYPSGTATHPAEIHMLVCKSDWLDGLWGLRSWCAAHHSIRFDLVLHEDGTVPPDGLQAFEHLFPGLKVIPRNRADEQVSRKLHAHPLCRRLRDNNPYSLKLFDIPLLATAGRRVIVFDADILFFHGCTELLKASADPEAPTRWNRDWREGYSIPHDELSRMAGFRVENLINSGLGTFQPESVDLDSIEKWLQLPAITEHAYPGRVEQTLVAMSACAWRHGFEFLPPPYDVHMGHTTPEYAPCRHYTGSVRSRFYSEGLFRLRHIAGRLPDHSHE